MYSGAVAGVKFRRLELPRRYVTLCPNHTGMGEPLAIMSRGAWHTPLGDVPVDSALADALKTAMPLLTKIRRHIVTNMSSKCSCRSCRFCGPASRIFVPITVGASNFDALSALGDAIGDLLADLFKMNLPWSIASSDMNHYESDSITRVKDRRAIDQVLALDPRGLYDTVRQGNISMCGYGPATIMLTAARKMGATKAELIRYATSGDVSGDRDMVVGYAGIAVH